MYSTTLLTAAVLSLLWLSAGGHATAQDAPREVQVARIFGRHHVEEVSLRLIRPDGSADPAAITELSILARPHDVDRPTEEAVRAHADDERWVAEGILRLDPGLASRVTRLAEAFPGHRIDIVSGFRPRARRTSRHRHGRALDLSIEGVEKERVTEVARALPDTGVGYYPNSHFTHIDVRESAYYWVDRSGPGERADYGTWPPPTEEVARTRREVFASVRAALGAFDDPAGSVDDAPPRIASAPSVSAPSASAPSAIAPSASAPSATALGQRSSVSEPATGAAAEVIDPQALPSMPTIVEESPDDGTPTTTFADFRRGPQVTPTPAVEPPTAADEDADLEPMSDEEYQHLRQEVLGTLRTLAGK